MIESKHLSRSISVVYRQIQSVMARQLEPLGIGMGQYAYIISVCRSPGITQDSLTGQLRYNKSTVARAVTQLEKNGFLRRETDPADRRSYLLYPTAKGLDVLPVILEHLEAQMDYLTSGFSPQERQTAEHLLSRMAAQATDTQWKGRVPNHG